MMKRIGKTAFGTFVLMTLLSGGQVLGSTAAEPLVSGLLLKEAGMQRQWQVQLAIKPGESVERMFVFDQHLLVLTNRNYLFGLNRTDGKYRFEARLAETRLPVCDPLYVDGKLYFLIGREMKVIDPVSGALLRSAVLTEVENNTQCSLTKNETFVYMAGIDQRIHAYRIEPNDYVQLFTATADDDSTITSLVATADRVFFTTESGSVVAMEAERPVKVWQFNASGPIIAPLVMDGEDLYAGSLDTKVYKLTAAKGAPAWPTPFYTGDKIQTAPVVGETVVYQYAGRSGLYAIDKQTGRRIWNVPSGRSMLCESGDAAYIFAQPGVLMVMDNRTGRERFSLNMAKVNRWAVNEVDSTLYLADRQGRVAAVATP